MTRMRGAAPHPGLCFSVSDLDNDSETRKDVSDFKY